MPSLKKNSHEKTQHKKHTHASPRTEPQAPPRPAARPYRIIPVSRLSVDVLVSPPLRKLLLVSLEVRPQPHRRQQFPPSVPPNRLHGDPSRYIDPLGPAPAQAAGVVVRPVG